MPESNDIHLDTDFLTQISENLEREKGGNTKEVRDNPAARPDPTNKRVSKYLSFSTLFYLTINARINDYKSRGR